MPSPSIAMLIGAAVFGAFASYVWHRRGNAGARALMLMLAAGVWYMVAYALELSSRGLDDKQLWGNLKYLGIGLLPPAWLAFTLQYTGRIRWLTRRLFVLLAVEPVAILALLTIPVTQDLVHVYPPAAGQRFPVVAFGPVGWVNVFYSYGLVVFSTGLFVKTLAAIARPYRKQARALIGALLVPFVFNVLYNFNVGPFGRVDLTSFTFFIAVVVLVWGIFRLRLLDILPVARSRIVETMLDGVIVLDAYQRIVDLNPAAQRILGSSPARAVGRSLQELGPEFAGLLDRSRASAAGEREIRMHVGSAVRSYEITLSSIPDDRGRESGKLMVLRDISERKATEERLEMMAHYDSLTGLPNRKLFIDRLAQAVIHARRHHHLVGLLFLDVDSFKDVNDTLGHDVGDILLQQLAIRLQACVRAEDTVARLSGDEFTVIIPEMDAPTAAVTAATRILEALERPLAPAGHELYVSMSIGICVWPTDGGDPGTLLRNADIAMYRAKALGRNRFEFYARELATHAARRLELEQDLRRAVDRREMRLYYQPIVSLPLGEVSSLEALIRWQHPKQGLLSPAQFMWCAEETGLIEPIGQWVLEESSREASTWGRSRLDPPSVSVNVAARQLRRSGFARDVADALDRTGLEPGRLVLEISESTVMDDTLSAAGILRDLKGLGVGLSLDDFGTGSTSLSQLGRFPLDVLKIDRLFVHGLGRDPHDAIVVQAMVSLAHALGLSVVAEGVETEEQLKILEDMECDLVQGFLISRPLPSSSMPDYVNGRTLSEIVTP
jgi:diguanylate cyclase (GGDEF)-like protein/PAS domain S-box-containing protein